MDARVILLAGRNDIMKSDVRVAALVSGGVDSAVSLALLKEQGYQVTAFYLKIWLEDELSYLGDCPWQEDTYYVQKVCDQLGVPLEIISLQKEYWQQVVSYTIAEVREGRTPNPDIMCNKRIKFGVFFDHISGKFDYVASGHYARQLTYEGRPSLWCSPDLVKDQTYFLSHLSCEQLGRLIFPIGHLEKHQVRAHAEQFNLANKDRKDSQGICFLGTIKFRDFIKHHMGTMPGIFVEVETGKKVGSHEGFWFYTIGQRQGLGLSGGPWYVVSKDTKTNTVFISRNYYQEDKQRDRFFVENENWFAGHPPTKNQLEVKLRHGAQRVACTLLRDQAGLLQVILSERDQGIAAGQFAVFYDGQQCLGSGVIL